MCNVPCVSVCDYFSRSGVFEIAEATGVRQGTKIVLHLKDDCKEFSAEDRVKGPFTGSDGFCITQNKRMGSGTIYFCCTLP